MNGIRRQQAWRRIGTWPGDTHGAAKAARTRNAGGLLGSRSEAHARQVWDEERWHVVNSAAKIDQAVDHRSAAFDGLVDLAFCSALGDHLARCRRCWTTGKWSQDTPADWLTWGVAQRRGLNRVLRPVLREERTELQITDDGELRAVLRA